MTAIDLFAGCGGLTLGLKQAGFRVVAAVDNDDLAVLTYRRNHRSTPVRHEDIRSVDPRAMREELRLDPGQLDLLAGCPPCQGFSSLRTLRGKRRVRDARNDLVFEFRRFVREFQPKAVMLENVPGLANDERLASLLRSLRGMGYSCRVRVLDAAEFGVPQRRRRMILLAGKGGAIPFARPLKSRMTVRNAIGGLPRPRESKDPLHRAVALHKPEILELIRSVPTNGGSFRALDGKSQLECHKRCHGFFDIYGRMSWDEVAPTITGGCVNPSKGRFLHPRQHRVVSLREAALLQTFPRNYSFDLGRGKYPAAQMIGNALPPRFVRRHALEVRRYVLAARKQLKSRGVLRRGR